MAENMIYHIMTIRYFMMYAVRKCYFYECLTINNGKTDSFVCLLMWLIIAHYYHINHIIISSLLHMCHIWAPSHWYVIAHHKSAEDLINHTICCVALIYLLSYQSFSYHGASNGAGPQHNINRFVLESAASLTCCVRRMITCWCEQFIIHLQHQQQQAGRQVRCDGSDICVALYW